MKQTELWSQPENGLLAGEIKSINATDTTAVLRNFEEREDFTIDIRELQQRDLEVLESAPQVRVVGIQDDEDGVFYACHVLPWRIAERPLDFKHIRENREEFLGRMKEFEYERNQPDARNSRCLDVQLKRQQSLRNNATKRALLQERLQEGLPARVPGSDQPYQR